MNHTYKNVASLIAAVLLVALGTSLSLWSYHQVKTSAEARAHTFRTIDSANNFLSELKDAETGQRGYSLTGDETFLEPYLAVRDNLRIHLHALDQLTALNSVHAHLAVVAPLLDDKLAWMAQLIELRRNHDAPAAQVLIASGHGNELMNSIRAEINSIVQIENVALQEREIAFQSSIRHMFVAIIGISISGLLFAAAFVYLMYQQAQQKVKNSVHRETLRLLEAQQETNQLLQQTSMSLRDSEEKLAVTLSSIGDAVIATDADARVTLLNPIAEQLTGWAQQEASGRRVDEIFHIVNKDTRHLAVIPVIETLAKGTIQGLANHTVLIARDGKESDIADSCAPIRGRDGKVIGAVLVFRDVTEDYAVQQALRDGTAQIQAILNTVVDGIITLRARDSVVETTNPATEKMFGYAATELVGKSFSTLIPELNQNQCNGSLEYYSASAEARAEGIGREVLGRRKNGTEFPLEISVTEMWLGGQRYFTGVLRDLTARNQAKEALLQAGALQNAIFNSANFSSIATDAKGVIQIFNVGAERMLGYDAADVMNKITPADISDPMELVARAQALSIELETPIASGFDALIFKASRGIEDIYELTYIRKDGSRFPAMVSVTALRDPRNSIIGYLLIGTDNTIRLRIEAERTRLDLALQDKNAELEIAKSAAEKANQAKSDFLSSMSHELRTPLSAILGFAQLLESGIPPPTISQARSVNQILKAGWYLLELINEILDLALIESGKLSLSMEPMALSNVMRECQSMIEPQAQQRGIVVTFHHFQTADHVNADRTRVKQVLINLLSNAIKYNRENGTVVVNCGTADTGRIRITVEDTGEGLSPEKLAHLFQPFNRLGQEAGGEEGTGIGLVVSRRLVDLMGGEIGAESTVGVGSKFWVELNSADVIPLIARTEAAVNANTHIATDTKYTLLYIEDNPANLMLVEDLIARRPDIHLLHAPDGMRGVELALEHLPDIILMDINLPGISGIQALRILTENLSTAHIPVIALSANAIPADIEKGLEAGFFRYLTKPIKINEFMDTLDLTLQFANTKARSAIKAEPIC